jgi:glycosyltransferase involved in cell wall biosynthesis
MRILQVVNSLCAGGAEKFVADLSIALARRGHTVALYCYAGVLDRKGERLQSRLRAAGVTVIADERRTALSKLAVPWRLRQAILRVRPDVVHSHLEQSDFFLMLSALFFGPWRTYRRVRTLHNVYASRLFPPWVHRMLARHFDVNVACGPEVLREHPYLRGATTTSIRNGVLMDDLHEVPAPQTAAHLHPTDEAGIVLVNVGSFSLRNETLQKAQDVIVRALALLGDAPVRLVLVGDGERRTQIAALANELGVSERVCFAGLVDNPEQFLRNADVVLMPSRFEGLPIACIEAVCTGKPVIVSDIAAFREFDGGAIRVVPAGDAGALAEKIRESLGELAVLKHAAQRDAAAYRQRFDIAVTAEQYLSCYLPQTPAERLARS